jgi:E3 ubiquitin-protein ligase HUWE1
MHPEAIVKLFHARRNPDSAQRKQIMSSSSVIADLMLKHVSQKNFGESSAQYSCSEILNFDQGKLGTNCPLLLI